MFVARCLVRYANLGSEIYEKEGMGNSIQNKCYVLKLNMKCDYEKVCQLFKSNTLNC